MTRLPHSAELRIMARPVAPILEDPFSGQSAATQDRAMSHFGGLITTGWKKSISPYGKSRSPRGLQMRSRSSRGSSAKEENHSASQTRMKPQQNDGPEEEKEGPPLGEGLDGSRR